MMKKTYGHVLKYIVLLAFAVMLLNPNVTLEGAKSGLILWFGIIIPSLLPAIILSNIIVSVYGGTFKNPFLYIVFTGLLCGYPLGAANTVMISKKNKNFPKYTQFLMAVCNNASPMFIINYCVITSLQQKHSMFPILFIIYCPLLLLLLGIYIYSSYFYKKDASLTNTPAKVPRLRGKNIDDSIMYGFEIVTKLGGYIILFSIFAAYVQSVPIHNEFIKCFTAGVLEITTGIQRLSASSLPMELKKLFCCVFISFGGLSCIAQTKSILENSGFSIKKYISHKLAISFLTFVIAYIMIYVFSF